jgi:hypothetical protein
MANPVIRIKRGTGSPVSLQLAELGFDKLNKKLFIGTEEGVFDLSGESYAKKTFVSDAVAAESDLRSAADSTLTSNLNAEISRAQGAESDLADDIAAETSARQTAVSNEQSAREAADTSLSNRLDAILDASDADKDSFAEIVALINSVDTENDTAFASYVISNDAALAQEVSDRQAGDSTLQGNIDTVASDLSGLTTRVSAAEQDILDEEAARIAAVSAEAAARAADVTDLEADIAAVQTNLDAESSSRSAADTALDGKITTEKNRIDALESVSSDSRLTDLESDVADHELRISSLETTIDGGVY